MHFKTWFGSSGKIVWARLSADLNIQARFLYVLCDDVHKKIKTTYDAYFPEWEIKIKGNKVGY